MELLPENLEYVFTDYIAGTKNKVDSHAVDEASNWGYQYIVNAFHCQPDNYKLNYLTGSINMSEFAVRGDVTEIMTRVQQCVASLNLLAAERSLLYAWRY